MKKLTMETILKLCEEKNWSTLEEKYINANYPMRWQCNECAFEWKANYNNTRKRKGLTPTPIANPSDGTIKSVLQFQKTPNLFYLHDANGKIWTAENVEGHNENKRNHL